MFIFVETNGTSVAYSEMMTLKNTVDVIIIGGSYAGLSAAMSLGRSLRNVLVLDNGKPCNKQTPYSHNFLTQDGKTPLEISILAIQQVEHYPSVTLKTATAVKVEKNDSGFTVETAEGEQFFSRKLIFATGIKDLLPDIKGIGDAWGKSVIHCPYCHGYEFREQKTGILANGEKAFHLAGLVSNLTKDLTIFTSGSPDFTPEHLEKLQRNNINVIESNVKEIIHSAGNLRTVILQDGTSHDLKALYAGIPFEQSTDIPEKLGCELNTYGHIVIDEYHKTSVPGVFACGDNSTIMRSVAGAVYAGNITGAIVNAELTKEQF